MVCELVETLAMFLRSFEILGVFHSLTTRIHSHEKIVFGVVLFFCYVFRILPEHIYLPPNWARMLELGMMLLKQSWLYFSMVLIIHYPNLYRMVKIDLTNIWMVEPIMSYVCLIVLKMWLEINWFFTHFLRAFFSKCASYT